MKLFIPLFLLFISSPLVAEDSISFLTDYSLTNEMTKIEELKKALAPLEFQTLTELMSDFNRAAEKLLLDEENKELTCELILRAHYLFTAIKKHHLKAYFSDEFLQELEFFSTIATKNQTLTAP